MFHFASVAETVFLRARSTPFAPFQSTFGYGSFDIRRATAFNACGKTDAAWQHHSLVRCHALVQTHDLPDAPSKKHLGPTRFTIQTPDLMNSLPLRIDADCPQLHIRYPQVCQSKKWTPCITHLAMVQHQWHHFGIIRCTTHFSLFS